MKYDEEYNSYKFNPKEMELILNALSYAHAHDHSLCQSDRDSIDGLYWLINGSRRLTSAS